MLAPFDGLAANDVGLYREVYDKKFSNQETFSSFVSFRVAKKRKGSNV
jgi:hypothetical protein